MIPQLEPAAQAFARGAAEAPALSGLGPADARQALEAIQAGPLHGPEVVSVWMTMAAGGVDVRARVVRPAGSTGLLPAVLYLHGGGWILGSADTHDRLVRELAVGANAAVVFVEYDRSPEARYPVALHQAHAAARWIVRHGASAGLDGQRLAVVGDSSGGNLAAALAILAKQRGDVEFVHQSLYYPVIDAAQDTESYREFAGGPHLTAASMAWFWDAYAPDAASRSEITASPLRASVEDLAGLPETFVIVDECDVLRDEGEAYARKLTAAGVRCTSVRYNGTLHDFMMLDAVRDTASADAAINQAIDVLRRALHPTPASAPPSPETPVSARTQPRTPPAAIGECELLTEAEAHVQRVLHPSIFSHTMRVRHLAAHLAQGTPVDDEALAVAALFHDSGTAEENDGTQRFEVEGADAAARFLAHRGWQAERIRSVWEAIALHTSAGIADRFGPLAQVLRTAVLVDLGRSELPVASTPELEEFLDRFPRLDIDRVLPDTVAEQALRPGREHKAPLFTWPGALVADRRARRSTTHRTLS
jgi:acetyl esterase